MPCRLTWHVFMRSLWRQREGQAGGPHTAGVRTNRPARLPLALSDSTEACLGPSCQSGAQRFWGEFGRRFVRTPAV